MSITFFLKKGTYLIASTGQVLKQRAQLKQSAGIFLPSTLPFAAS